MDIEKLIERLKQKDGLWCSVPTGENLIADAIAAIEALRADLEQERAHRIHAEQHADAFLRDCERLNAELEQVKWERDAAVSDLETIMAYNSDTCQFCKNGQCYVRDGTKSCLPKWRGQKEE